MNLKEIFYPDLPRILIFLGLGILFWIFPIFSKSVYAITFVNFEINYFSILNFILAYIFASLIVFYQQKIVVVLGIIFLIVVLLFAMPKVMSYGVGDIGWIQHNYCSCIYGIASKESACCGSTVEHCMGLCLRNESTTHGP